jgi:plastocyanin
MNRTIIGIIVIVLLGLGAYALMNNDPNDENTAGQATTTENGSAFPTSTATGTGQGGGSSVTYTATGFSPKSVTIKRGQSVTWTNQGGGNMWVASAPHPQHTAYSGTSLDDHCPDANNDSLDACGAKNVYTFTFDKAGTWQYHNHAAPSNFGTVIVTE